MLSSTHPALPTELIQDLQQFMLAPDYSDAAFNAMALRIFKHQFQHNLAYQRYCQHLGKTPRFITHWHDIPAVPINAFKDATLSCYPPELCQHVFMTSGTTQKVRGRNYHPDTTVYDLSMRLYFKERFMADQDRIQMGIIFPTAHSLPNSSLAHYLGLALTHFGTESSRYFIDEKGLQIDALCAHIESAIANNEPYALLGASYSFVHLVDELQQRQCRFQLPTGSRLFDTGGFKGQSRDIELSEFYAGLYGVFGVAPNQCINMYGMTELSSQLYDNGNHDLPSVKSGPHWTRFRLVDPLTGTDVPQGEAGVVVHYDLANYNSVSALLTEDLGLAKDDGFQLLGRVAGAEAKGCSLAMEHFLQAVQ